MSKIIKMSQDDINNICEELKKTLADMKLSDGKLTLTKSFTSVDRKATLFFNELAYFKMLTLVREFDKEIAWHGVAFRGDDPEKDEYTISDIMVYPQVVTAANVDTDQEKYQMWLYSFEDEIFDNIRMQGHSHVNMGTTPSSVDNNFYDQILGQLNDQAFYIFLVWNKRGEHTIKIYDLAKNILFEDKDIDIEIVPDGTGIEKFLADAKKNVETKSYTYTPAKTEPTKKEPEKKEPKIDTSKPRKTSDRKLSGSYWGDQKWESYYGGEYWGNYYGY